ncbi:TetR/AcrR family transcriptional regulator [Paenibacillus agri]|uniref:WHG domain-containing protein n=1 Tax=Paenibacillus agri TaxID=2744309 RepID=A0A850ERH6_9BACL|nr:TetR/AcrR family transcriptional regulator [Paenibacillus agri]NUU62127.1 WHG domain-containing protein [Paenibacillus agri]
MSPRAGLDVDILVRAAAEIADEEGIEEVTLARLAAKLGVRSPSLYNHINGLQGLRTQLAIYGLGELNTAIASAAEGLSGDDAVQAMGRAYVEFARSRPGLYKTTLSSPDPNNAELVAASERILSLIINLLQVYNLGKEGELHAVRGLRSILHGFASIVQEGGFGMPLDTNISLSRLIAAFLTGIGQMNIPGKYES